MRTISRAFLLALFASACLLATVTVDARTYFGSRADTDYCYSTDPSHPQYLHFNTKTPYQLAKGGESVVIPTGCTASKFWILNRHGTRLPTANKIVKLQDLPTHQAEIIANYANGGPSVGGLCPEDLTLLASWRWDTNITAEKDGHLTVQGWNDLKGIAQFYKAQFPPLFGAYSKDKYHFLMTESQRTEASFRGFVDGLFGEEEYLNIPGPETDNELLRPYQECALWRAQEDELKGGDSELSKFERSDIYQQVLKDVSAKAGYSAVQSSSVIDMIFDMCSTEFGWDVRKSSPWCTLFNLDQTKVFEYAADIEDWFVTGPVSTLNKRLSCSLVQDLLAKLGSTDGPTTSAYFSHSTMVQLFLTGLGYTETQLGNPLRADNFDKMADRTFSTSFNSPLASHVAAVRYDCGEGPRIQFLLNERPLQLSWCTNGLCDWKAVQEKFAEVASQTCSTYHCSSGSARMVSLLAILAALLVSMFSYIM